MTHCVRHYRHLALAVLTAFLLFAGLNLALRAAGPQEPEQAVANLRINEFMADNRYTLEDPDEPGEHPDWIELYNPGPNPVSLNGLALTDNASKLSRFPITSGLSIPAGGFLIFYADNDPTQGPRHLNFALSRNDGFIGLFNLTTEALIDHHTYGLQNTDISQGRAKDGNNNWRLFDTPTPGATNNLLPPRISNVQQQPEQPGATDAVTISAVITDERGVAGATLFYSVTGSSVVAVPMTATGNSYVAVIPPFPDNTFVRYYLSATDIDDLVWVAPLAGAEQPFRYAVGFQAPLLYINELMADNERALVNPDRAGDFPDWIELYNPGPNSARLDGLFLTDSRNAPTQFAIPLGLTIPPNGYMLFFADNQPELGDRHLNFRLSKNGDYVGLYGASGQVLIDSFEYEFMSANASYNRVPDGGGDWVQTACFTPGKTNDPCTPQAHLPLIEN